MLSILVIVLGLGLQGRGQTNRVMKIDFRKAGIYDGKSGYGFDYGTAYGEPPFYFSVRLPEGNYVVRVRGKAGTVKVENRRLMAQGCDNCVFTVHVRDSVIRPAGSVVRLKPRERAYLHWDNKLTLEFLGDVAMDGISIEPAEAVTTIFLAGNSTVVDQAEDPWAAWGQMIPVFFQPGKVAVANYAESGETLKAFIRENRLAKLLSMAKPGDYLFIEFAHNDQKAGGNHVDPWTSYKEMLNVFIDSARGRGMNPVLVTSMNRRSFDSSGRIINTLGDYPAAMRQEAKERGVPLIDLNEMSRILYEAWGPELSLKAFVHYPAHTWPGQEVALKDDTHFNVYGAYELSKCVVEGIRGGVPHLAKLLAPKLPAFDPSRPDPIDQVKIPISRRIEGGGPVSRPDEAKDSDRLKMYVITQYGVSDDSTKIQTEAIQKVIDKAWTDGGGTIVVPKGVYSAGALFFRPGTRLLLQEGAVLKGSDNIIDYPLIPSRMEGQNQLYYAALINAYYVDSFSITGPGTINGNGLRFWESFWAHRDSMNRIGKPWTNLEVHRPRLLFIWGCNNVTIQKVKLHDSGFWTTHLYECNNVLIEGCDIRSPFKPVAAPSTDGVDIDVCKKVTIRDCYISVNDDAVCIKGGKGPDAHKLPQNGMVEDVLVENCIFGESHGTLTLGSEAIHVKNITIRNCKVDNHVAILRLKMRPDTYQIYENISVEGITGRCGTLISLAPWTQFYNLNGSSEKPFATVRNISFSNIHVECDKVGSMKGNPDDKISDMLFKDITVTASDSALEANHYPNIKTENVIVNGKPIVVK